MGLSDFAVITAGVLAVGLVITGILHFSGFTRKFREARNQNEEIFPGALSSGDPARGPKAKRPGQRSKYKHGGRLRKRSQR